MLVFASAAQAGAPYDMSGKWLVDGYVRFGGDPLRLNLTQTSGSLFQHHSNSPGWTGSIDEATGAFELSSILGLPGHCGGMTIEGTVAADSRTFSATASYEQVVSVSGQPFCLPKTVAVTGSRCGNLDIESWEDCDLGDNDDGDCCSSACEFDSTVTACASDDNACTDDVCDGAGACSHPFNDDPCSESAGCATGVCAAGACDIDAFAGSGTACDLDERACSEDTCDGSGICVAGDDSTCPACGNDELEAGEQCDDGNLLDGDCCSSTCTFRPAGATCPDADVCTTDTCDGAGTCVHVFNEAPCAETSCGLYRCSEGSCELFDALEGEPCDLDGNACTDDACGSDGECAAGSPVDCGTCERCDTEDGCVPFDYSSCDDAAERIQLAIKADSDPSRDRFKLKYVTGVPGDLGNPTLDTSYEICIHEGTATLFRAELAPGGTCGSADCWQTSESGFRYKDRSQSSDGIASMSVGSDRFQVKGSGAELNLVPDLPSSTPIVATIIADDATPACWSHEIAIDKQTSTSLKASYRAP